MNIWQLFRCALGRHHRDGGRAWHDGNVFRSICVGCGRKMLRDFDGWRPERPGEGAKVPNPDR